MIYQIYTQPEKDGWVRSDKYSYMGELVSEFNFVAGHFVTLDGERFVVDMVELRMHSQNFTPSALRDTSDLEALYIETPPVPTMFAIVCMTSVPAANETGFVKTM